MIYYTKEEVERDFYEGRVAVAYEVLNRQKRDGGSRYDVWLEDNICEKLIVISNKNETYRNVFFSPTKTVHNQVTNKTEDAVVLYDHRNGKWLCEEGVVVIKYVE